MARRTAGQQTDRARALLLGMVDDLVDLAVPRTCGGCGAARVRWCARCEAALHDVPARIRTTVAVGAPVYTLGRYDGPRRRAVLELKERGRGDLAEPLGRALAHAVLRMRHWGDLGAADSVLLIPAPTTRWAARVRGGNVVTAMCQHAATTMRGPESGRARVVCPTVVAPVLRSVGAVDSVGLSAAQRARNVAGTVRLRGASALRPGLDEGCAVVLVDDVITTGATLAESAAALERRGVRVRAAITVAAA